MRESFIETVSQYKKSPGCHAESFGGSQDKLREASKGLRKSRFFGCASETFRHTLLVRVGKPIDRELPQANGCGASAGKILLSNLRTFVRLISQRCSKRDEIGNLDFDGYSMANGPMNRTALLQMEDRS